MQLEVISLEPQGTPKPVPVLLIHGAYQGAWCYEDTFMPTLAARGYRVYAMSLRGHGKSEGGGRWASVEDYVADVRQVADNIEPHPVLIGHSMGGYIVQKYLAAYAHEATIPGAVLLASAPLNGTLPFILRNLPRYPKQILSSFLQLDANIVIQDPNMTRYLFVSDAMPAEAFNAAYAKMGGESTRIQLDMMFRPPAARRYDLPLLVLGAIHDTTFTRAEIAQTARAYGTEAEFFNMGHAMMLDVGWESVIERIGGWLDEVFPA